MKKIKASYDHIIIGASKAGLTAASVLREGQSESSILLINGEDRLPYKRTQLTKHLYDGFEREDFALYEAAWYTDQKIDLINTNVLAVHPADRTLECSDGQIFSWGALLLATGAVPREISIPGNQWIKHLRTASDTENLRNELLKCKSVLVLGQGVEGIELAEQCSRMGLSVTLTGRDNRLMQRWLDEEQSQRLKTLMEGQGIRCVFGQNPYKVEKVRDGYTLCCPQENLQSDIILSSTGIRGNPGLAEKLGIYGKSGILTDLCCQTGIPGIFAAGDAVQSPPGWPTGLWHWAEYQGMTAAHNMRGHKQELVNRPTRLKSEPFGSFYYSMSYQEVLDSDKSDVFKNDNSGYVRIFSREGRSMAALMTGLGKGISKILDAGIKSGESPQKIYDAIMEATEA